MPQSPAQAADALYTILPHALTRATLEEYGIDATPEQARQITREILSVNLYWIRSALDVSLSKEDAERIYGALRERLVGVWTSELGLEGYEPEQYFEEVQTRRQIYDQIARESGPPIAVLKETASLLEADGAISAEDYQKILALLIDIVPVEGIGETVQEFA